MRIDSATATDISSVRAAMGTIVKTTNREISDRCKNIPAGWPRAYYRGEDNKPRYTQWSSDMASSQIMSCSVDRTWTAAKNFACTCCAQIMERGLFLDQDWMNADLAARHPQGINFGKSVYNMPEVRRRYDEFDTGYGGALCHRCLVFALKHCPFFSQLLTAHGEDLQFVEVRSAYDYAEFDESSACELTEAGQKRDRITLAQVRQRVLEGQLFLTERSVADAIEKRPADYASERLTDSIWNYQEACYG